MAKDLVPFPVLEVRKKVVSAFIKFDAMVDANVALLKSGDHEGYLWVVVAISRNTDKPFRNNEIEALTRIGQEYGMDLTIGLSSEKDSYSGRVNMIRAALEKMVTSVEVPEPEAKKK